MIRIRPVIPRNAWRGTTSIREWNPARSAATSSGGKRGRPKDPKKSPTTYWNEEKLSIIDKYPLTAAIAKMMHPEKEMKSLNKKIIHVRTQIVSPDLCDDVLKYVGHKLDKHKGCDILDINPGTGLWSQKLHEYLQPRSHVLLEQQHERFKPFLDPLLTAPGSKYSLIDKDPTVLQTYRDIVADGVFPHQTVLDAQDPRAQEPNNTLLVTGSLAWDPRLPGLGFDSMAKQLAYHLASAAWTNDLFHAFGLVRTLFWVQHDDYNSMIADSINGLSKTTRLMGMYQNTNVFVQPDRTTRKSGRASVGREPQYEIETTVRALRAGREHGMELPSHRRDSIHEFAEHLDKISNGTGISSFNEMQDYLREQQLAGKNTISLLPEGVIEYYKFMKHIINVFPEIDLGEREDLTGRRSRRSVPRGHPYKDDIQEFYRQSTVMTNTFKKRLQVSATADIGEAMYKLECKILDMQDGPAKDAAMTELKDLETKWNHAVESLNANYSKAAAVEIDDRLAIRSTPLPRLEFDARSFEPLTMRSNEVWPQNRLSLISGEPNPRPVGGSPDFYEWVRDFIFGLFVQPSEGVSHALDKMQHGLGHIIKECPSLRDPKKGGRLQMEHLRVRMLTPEMIFELAEAYRNWPFKEPGSDNFQYFKYKHSAHPYVPRHGEH